MAEQLFLQCKTMAELSREFLVTEEAYGRTCCQADKERSSILEGV
jgi:hypothetical protein